jgi:hypothetical protein
MLTNASKQSPRGPRRRSPRPVSADSDSSVFTLSSAKPSHSRRLGVAVAHTAPTNRAQMCRQTPVTPLFDQRHGWASPAKAPRLLLSQRRSNEANRVQVRHWVDAPVPLGLATSHVISLGGSGRGAGGTSSANGDRIDRDSSACSSVRLCSSNGGSSGASQIPMLSRLERRLCFNQRGGQIMSY